MASFFLTALGLSLGAKLVSTNDSPSIFLTICSLFSCGGKKINCAAFCTIRLDGQPRFKDARSKETPRFRDDFFFRTEGGDRQYKYRGIHY